jgi:hypothetical protein
MALRGEMEYYAGLSGLPATATLVEHQRAYWAAQAGISPAGVSTNELEIAFLRAKLPDDAAAESLTDMRRRWYMTGSALGTDDAVSDYLVETFAGGGGPGPSAGYGLMPYGLGPYGL